MTCWATVRVVGHRTRPRNAPKASLLVWTRMATASWRKRNSWKAACKTRNFPKCFRPDSKVIPNITACAIPPPPSPPRSSPYTFPLFDCWYTVKLIPADPCLLIILHLPPPSNLLPPPSKRFCRWSKTNPLLDSIALQFTLNYIVFVSSTFYLFGCIGPMASDKLVSGGNHLDRLDLECSVQLVIGLPSVRLLAWRPFLFGAPNFFWRFMINNSSSLKKALRDIKDTNKEKTESCDRSRAPDAVKKTIDCLQLLPTGVTGGIDQQTGRGEASQPPTYVGQ